MKKPFLKLIVWATVFGSVLSFSAQTQFAQNSRNKACLVYEPATVSFNGTLGRRTVASASGRRQTIWVLKLAAPACVAADPKNEINGAVGRVTEVQLVFTSAQMRRYGVLASQKVEIRGTLFAAHTQHHFTDVLMIVAEARKK